MLIITSALVIFSISTISFSQVQPEVESTFRGDINEDGQVNIFDFLELLKVLGNTSGKTDRTLQIADVDANGGVNIFDLLGLLKVLAGSEQPDVIYWGPAIIGLNSPSAALGDTIDIAVANIEETVSVDDVKAYIGGCEIGILDFSLENVRIVIPEGFTGGNLWLMIGSDTTNSVICNYKVRQHVQASVGGNVKHPIGASVSIPIGALQEDISISINEITRETIKSLGILEDTCEVLVELGPTGSVFSLPVTVGLPWPKNVSAQDSLEGVYFNTEEGNWASLPTVQRDMVNRILYVRMEHFTIVKSRKKTYSLQGLIFQSGSGLEGVNVSVIGNGVDTTLTTGTNGNYRLDDLKDGIYMIIPFKSGYTFNPSNVQASINKSDASVVDIGASKILDTPLLNDPGSIVCSCISYILNWSKVSGATSYTIEESDNNNFTISTRYIISDTLHSFIHNVSTTTTYYYRVKANSATDSSTWSNTVDLVVNSLAVLPPVLNDPGDSATINSIFTLGWSQVEGATKYLIEISSSDSFGNTDSLYTSLLRVIQIQNVDRRTTFYYRVLAILDSGTTNWSNVENIVLYIPVIPQIPLVSDPGSSVNTDTNYTVSWMTAVGALSYTIEEATDSSFTVAISQTTSDTSRSFSHNVTKSTAYYYRVKANSAAGSSDWSITVDIIVNPPPPSMPFLNDPGSIVSSDSNYKVSWSSVSVATSYTIEESTDSLFSGVVSQTVTDTSQTFSHRVSDTNTYYYRVKAINNAGSSNWSNTVDMLVNPPPPSTPVVADPGSNVASGASYTVSWSSVTGAASYTIEEATNNSFSGATSQTVSSTSQSFSRNVSAVTTYYYHVRSNSTVGNSGWSNVVDITVYPTAGYLPDILLFKGGTAKPGVTLDLTVEISLHSPALGGLVLTLEGVPEEFDTAAGAWYTWSSLGTILSTSATSTLVKLEEGMLNIQIVGVNIDQFLQFHIIPSGSGDLITFHFGIPADMAEDTITLTAVAKENLMLPWPVTNPAFTKFPVVIIDPIIIKGSSIQLPTMVSIPAGTFQMGSTTGDSIERPVHEVTVSGFEMSKYEITNTQYAEYLNAALDSGEITVTSSSIVIGAAGDYSGYVYLSLLGSNDSNNKCWISYNNNTFTVASGKENWPVVYVTWWGAKAFALKNGFDLPREAEWEYAARGGKQYEYGTDDGTIGSDKANYNWNVGYPKDVGSYPANPFGLFDLTGNVREWCNDWYGSYSSENENDPRGPSSGSTNISRGGDYVTSTSYCRSATRLQAYPGVAAAYRGFRVVRR